MTANLDRLWSLIRQLQGALGGNRVIRGVVDATSGTPSILEGDGFTITDNGVGDYTINFTTAFGDVPAVTVTARRCAAGVVAYAKLDAGVAPTASAARVSIVRLDTLALNDGEFHFTAVGPQ
jgi:hypothetical protein